MSDICSFRFIDGLEPDSSCSGVRVCINSEQVPSDAFVDYVVHSMQGEHDRISVSMHHNDKKIAESHFMLHAEHRYTFILAGTCTAPRIFKVVDVPDVSLLKDHCSVRVFHACSSHVGGLGSNGVDLYLDYPSADEDYEPLEIKDLHFGGISDYHQILLQKLSDSDFSCKIWFTLPDASEKVGVFNQNLQELELSGLKAGESHLAILLPPSESPRLQII